MKIRKIMICMAAWWAAAAMAGINNSDAEGCVERAQAMLTDGNYIGCVDEADAAFSQPMTAELRQRATLLKGKALTHIDRAIAATLLEGFLADYPASPLRSQAELALGDCYYGPEYPQSYRHALDIYDSIDPQLLPWEEQLDLAYRKAFCLIEIASGLDERRSRALYERAIECLNELAGTEKYGRAAQFYKGYIAYAQGEYAKAEATLTPLRNFGAPCNMADFYLAQIAYLRGDWSKALSMSKSLLGRQGIDKQYADEALRLAGESAYRTGDDAQARKYLAQYSLSAEAPQASALYILGVYDYQDGDYANAVKMLAPAAAMDNAMGQSANLYIGQAMMKEGDYDGAALSLAKAKDMAQDRSAQETAHYNFAVASLRGGTVPFGGGAAAFEDFMRAFPDSRYAAEAQRYVIDSYFSAGNYAGALKSIESMTRPTAESQKAKLMALYLLGAQALERGNAEEATSHLEKTSALAKYDAATAREATLLLGEAQYREGKYAQAAKSVQDYLNKAPRTAENRGVAYLDLGYALFAQKKYAKATQAFEHATDDGTLPTPIRADAACRLGDCQYYAKDFAEASNTYDRAYALNPAVGDYALLQKALMEGYQRNHWGKIAYLERLQDEFPKSPYIPDAMLEMTESRIQLSDYPGAIKIYRELVEKYPGTSQGRQGYLQMALTMLNSGDKEGAVQAYKDVVRLYPTSEEASQGAEALKRIAAEEGWLADYADFINSVPGAPKFDASEAEELEFEAAEKAFITAGNATRLKTFAEKRRESRHRAKALSYLLQNATENNDADVAYGYASALIDDYPDNGLALEAYAVKADIDEQRGKRTLALKAWQALEERASTPYYLDMARMGVARNALELAEYGLAEEAAQASVGNSAISDRDKNEALYILGAALRHQNKTDQARQAWMQAAEDVNDAFGIRSAFELAQLSFDEGDLDRAENEAKEVANSNSQHAYWVARAFILLSDVYARQGNEYKAEQYLKSLHDNYPGSEEDIFRMIEERM
ncbi:MAG: tetratricopeptide repeat protein [Clostridium sp.]|nr:tetratricopeptide repeat protein [Clostridium sp.]